VGQWQVKEREFSYARPVDQKAWGSLPPKPLPE
jgi:hypothetical protein